MNTGGILEDNGFLPFILSLTQCAAKSIYISTFKAELTHKPRGKRLLELFENLGAKVKEGVDVRVLIGKSDNYGHIPHTNLFAVRYMLEQGIKVRHIRNNRTCHAKIFIVDNEVAVIGSHNLGVKSCHNNFEVSNVIYDQYRVEVVRDIYRKVWDNAKQG